MRRMRRLAAVATVAAVIPLTAAAAATAIGDSSPQRSASSIDLENGFDHIGAEVHELTHNGRQINYIDEGRPGQRAVVFLGGQATSLEAFQLTEFARTTRQELGLRVISIERNGFGESPYNGSLGYADYKNEVLAVLDHLGIDKFVIVAISGGGNYASHLAAAVPSRVISLHLAAAGGSTLPNRNAPNCALTFAQRNTNNLFWYENPKSWWGVPGSPVLVVPGWQDTAYNDATRSFHLGGGPIDPSPLSHEAELPCLTGAVADTALITSPAYLYWGGADTTVPTTIMDKWKAVLPNVKRSTVYPGEGHTVQYRHWDQILTDMAGHTGYTVICKNDRTKLEKNKDVAKLVSKGATLGNCAWTP